MRRPTEELVSGFPSLKSVVAEFRYSNLTFPAAMSSKFARVALRSRADILIWRSPVGSAHSQTVLTAARTRPRDCR